MKGQSRQRVKQALSPFHRNTLFGLVSQLEQGCVNVPLGAVVQADGIARRIFGITHPGAPDRRASGFARIWAR